MQRKRPYSRPAAKIWNGNFRIREVETKIVLQELHVKETKMDVPYTIASLPKPLDTEHGSIHASPVFSLRGSTKRKRQEVAVGIDGEGVNIYDVQSQSLATSYALPPQSYLCCAPCSVYCKRGKNAAAQRRTYLVVRDGAQDRKRRLVCLTEDVGGLKQIDDQLSAPAKKKHMLRSGDILSLDVITTSAVDTMAPQVLVSYRNGDVVSVSGDLTAVLWEHDARTSKDTEHPSEHEYAGVTNLETSRRGLLAGREDVTAMLGPEAEGAGVTAANGHPLLCRVVRAGTRRYLQLYALQSQSQDRVQSQKPGLQLLMDYDLPTMSRQTAALATYDLHSASGRLYQLLDGQLTVYDLTGTIPRVATTFGSKSEPVISFARISTSSVLVVFAGKAVVYETKYGSVQASTLLSSQHSSETPDKKRNRNEGNQIGSTWHAVSCLSELGLVVLLSNAELVALQLTDVVRSTKRMKPAGILLSDVLGKGAVYAAPKLSHKAEKSDKRPKWEEWKANLDAAINDYDVPELEELVARALKLKSEDRHRQLENISAGDMQLNGTSRHDRLKVTPGSFDTDHIDRRKVIYILSKCFRIGSDEELVHSDPERLTMLLGSERVYKWLALAGFVTIPYIQQALHLRDNHSGIMPTVLPGDIMASLRWFDDFELVHDMLALPIYWEGAEVIEALKLLIQSFDTPAGGSTPRKGLPAPLTRVNGDTTMTNGYDADSQVESELLATEKDLDHAVSALASGLELRSETLRLVLRRLHAFPQKMITQAMRTMMKHDDIIFFMKILRIELLEGGWTSRYIDLGIDDNDAAGALDGAEEALRPSDQAIGAISDLMNCAIDAIGTSGWLIGQSGDSWATEELIDGLKSEVSATLEGLFEADTVSTFLDELQRYESSTRNSHVYDQRRKKMALDEDVELEDALLPVGCRAEAPVVKGKGGRDGNRNKAAAFAKERRGRVGRYEIDRIRI